MTTETKFKQTEIGLIPEDWEVKELNEIASYITEKINLDEINATNFVSTENMLPEKRGITLSSSLPKVGKVTQFKEGDILFSNIRTYFKKLWLARFSGGCSNDVLVIRKQSFMNDKYLYYYLSQDNFFDFTVLTSKGTKMPRGDKNSIMSYKINIPPILEQSAIAAILSSLDSKIELNQQMNKTLEAIGQAIFKHWFIDFEFPNEEGKPYKSSGGEMVYNEELGKEIPKGWEVCKLGEFYDFLEGPGIRNWQYSKEGTRFINIRLINNKDIDVNSANFINQKDVDTKYQHFLLKEGDLVVSTSGTLGRNAIVRKNHLPLLLNTSVIRFRPKDNTSYPFMYQYFNSSIFLEEQIALASGSVQSNFGPMHLNKMSIIIPPDKILNLFNSALKPVYNRFTKNLDENQTLSQIRDSLLPKLMSGKIRVPVEDK